MGFDDAPLTGSCLCGAVQVCVDGPPMLTLACHCRDCQKMTASGYSLGMMVQRAGFSCSGELITGGRGGPGRTRYFCASCLNLIYTQIDGAQERVNLRLSVLDRAEDFPPFVEVNTEEKLPWAEVSAKQSFARGPETPEAFQALLDAYQESIAPEGSRR